jgi:PAS domain S-box-containing protein
MSLALSSGEPAGRSVSEMKFERLANNMPVMCWMADETGYIYWYNRRWYDYTGKAPSEMEGWGWQSVHHPRLLEAVNRRWSTCLASGEPFEMTFPLRSASGEFRPFLTRVQPYRNDDSVLIGWFGNNIDISAQAKAEEALLEAGLALKASVVDAFYLAAIVESSNDAIIGKDCSRNPLRLARS